MLLITEYAMWPTFHQLANDLLDPLPASIKRKNWEIFKSCGSAPGHVMHESSQPSFTRRSPPLMTPDASKVLGRKGPVNLCALRRLTTRPQPRSTPSQDSSPREMNRIRASTVSVAMPADSRCEKNWNRVWNRVWNCRCETVKECRCKTLGSWTGLKVIRGRFGVFFWGGGGGGRRTFRFTFRFAFRLALKNSLGQFRSAEVPSRLCWAQLFYHVPPCF